MSPSVRPVWLLRQEWLLPTDCGAAAHWEKYRDTMTGTQKKGETDRRLTGLLAHGKNNGVTYDDSNLDIDKL